jgi:hypothetical protein
MEATDPSLAQDDPSRLARIVDGLVQRRHQIAALQAEEARLLHEAQRYALERMDAPTLRSPRPTDIPLRSVAAEIGAATVQSDRTVQARMGEAATLVEQFPATWTALHEGRLGRAHASVIAEAGGAIDDADARAGYENAIIPIAEFETAGRLRPMARRLAELHHPVSFDERHRAARRERRVWVTDGEDGMAELGLLAPAHLIHGAFDRITRFARTIVDARRPGTQATHETQETSATRETAATAASVPSPSAAS